MLLKKLISLQYIYENTTLVLRLLSWPAVILLALGMFLGLVVAPADYQQGDAFRIIYVHVPSAFFSLAIYLAISCAAVIYLVWHIKIFGLLLKPAAEIGFIFTLVTLITGSIWGKPMWGAFWVWDARLTSELVLLFLYLGILCINERFSLKNYQKMQAILSIVGVVDLPIIHYSVYWWNSLHQGQTFTILAAPKIHPSMLYPIIFMLLGLGLYTIVLLLLKLRPLIIKQEKRSAWVQAKLQDISA
jgi:heme exporter protein C